MNARFPDEEEEEDDGGDFNIVPSRWVWTRPKEIKPREGDAVVVVWHGVPTLPTVPMASERVRVTPDTLSLAWWRERRPGVDLDLWLYPDGDDAPDAKETRKHLAYLPLDCPADGVVEVRAVLPEKLVIETPSNRFPVSLVGGREYRGMAVYGVAPVTWNQITKGGR